MGLGYLIGKKLWHLTPQGVERCHLRSAEAWLARCEHKHHYVDFETAKSQLAILEDNKAFEQELKDLQRKIKTLSGPETVIFTSYFHLDYAANIRTFNKQLDDWVAMHSRQPQIYNSVGSIHLRDTTVPYKVNFKRKVVLNEDYRCFEASWSVELTEKNMRSRNQEEKILKAISLNMDQGHISENDIAQVKDFIHNAVEMHAIYNIGCEDGTEKGQDRADHIFKQFLNMFNAVESAATGDGLFSQWGFGYFKASTDAKIIVEEEYGNSAFRGDNFSRFLRETFYWAGSITPDVEIRVSDRNQKMGTSWAIRRFDGQWSVETQMLDGNYTDYLTDTAQEVFDNVYWSVVNDVQIGDKEAALEKARYAYYMMHAVEESLKEHRETVSLAFHSKTTNLSV